MMIGPAPMINTLRMSVRFGIRGRPPRLSGTAYGLGVRDSSCFSFFHEFREAIEQIADVVRARARLGMALEAERGPVDARHALQAAVEQRHMGRPKLGRHGSRVA